MFKSLRQILKDPKSQDSRYLSGILSNRVANATWVFIRAILLIGLSFVLIYPLLYTLSISIRPSEEILNPLSIWIPRKLTTVNFVDAFTIMKYPQTFWNSIKIGFVSSAIQVISCSMVGYGFAKFRFPGRNLLFALVLFTIIVPPQLVIVPSYIQFRYFDLFGLGYIAKLFTGTTFTINLLDKVWCFYIPAFFGTGLRSGLFIFVFRQFFKGMPKELQESACIDGCGHFMTFLKVIIPNAVSPIVTVTLFSVVWYWNDYFHTSMYFNNMRTVSLALSRLKEDFLVNLSGFSYASIDPYILVTRIQAGVLLTLAPVLILYIFLQKYFVESIERTGIVG